MELAHLKGVFVKFLLKNAAFQYFTLGFRAAVYKADSSHYGCPVPKNPLTNQVRYLISYIGHNKV